MDYENGIRLARELFASKELFGSTSCRYQEDNVEEEDDELPQLEEEEDSDEEVDIVQIAQDIDEECAGRHKYAERHVGSIALQQRATKLVLYEVCKYCLYILYNFDCKDCQCDHGCDLQCVGRTTKFEFESSRRIFLGRQACLRPVEREVIMWNHLAEAHQRYLLEHSPHEAPLPVHQQFNFRIGDRHVSE